jgi:transposase InsO family protein
MTSWKVKQISSAGLMFAKGQLEKVVPLADVCAALPIDGSGEKIQVSPNTLKSAFKAAKMEFPKLSRGAKKKPVPPYLIEVISKFRQEHIKLGVTKTSDRIYQDFFLKSQEIPFDPDADEIIEAPLKLASHPKILLSTSDDSLDECQQDSQIPGNFDAKKDDLPELSKNAWDYLSGLEAPPSNYTVYKAFQQENLLRYTRKKPPSEPVRCRYVACYVNMIWHADIHYMGKQRNLPIYAIIDDASRYIIEWSLLASKHASRTRDVAKAAMRKFGKPYAFWTDNGGENRGDFQRYLTKHGINSIFTEAYTPQQNGKIERFWPTLEFNCINVTEIQRCIDEYNTTPHRGLPKNEGIIGRKVSMSPKIAFDNLPHFTE